MARGDPKTRTVQSTELHLRQAEATLGRSRRGTWMEQERRAEDGGPAGGAWSDTMHRRVTTWSSPTLVLGSLLYEGSTRKKKNMKLKASPNCWRRSTLVPNCRRRRNRNQTHPQTMYDVDLNIEKYCRYPLVFVCIVTCVLPTLRHSLLVQKRCPNIFGPATAGVGRQRRDGWQEPGTTLWTFCPRIRHRIALDVALTSPWCFVTGCSNVRHELWDLKSTGSALGPLSNQTPNQRGPMLGTCWASLRIVQTRHGTKSVALFHELLVILLEGHIACPDFAIVPKHTRDTRVFHIHIYFLKATRQSSKELHSTHSTPSCRACTRVRARYGARTLLPPANAQSYPAEIHSRFLETVARRVGSGGPSEGGGTLYSKLFLHQQI